MDILQEAPDWEPFGASDSRHKKREVARAARQTDFQAGAARSCLGGEQVIPALTIKCPRVSDSALDTEGVGAATDLGFAVHSPLLLGGAVRTKQGKGMNGQ